MLAYLTHIFPMYPFDPPENNRKPQIFCCIQGDQKGTLRRNRLKVQSCKLYNNKYMIASTQITNAETFAFIAV